MCSRWLFEFINFSFHATTKSWIAHQKVRLDELAWKKWVSDVFMETVIELSRKPFRNLLLWCLLVFAELLLYVALPLAIKNPCPPPRLRRTSFAHPPTESKGGEINHYNGMWSIQMAEASCRRPLNLFSPGAHMLWRRCRGNATFACAFCLFSHPQKYLWGAHGNLFGASEAIFMPGTHIFSCWATFWDCLGHLGVPGWSGAGFIRNLGYLWSALWTSISKFWSKKWYWVGFSWTFCYTSSGDAFQSPLHECSGTRKRGIYPKPWEGCLKTRLHASQKSMLCMGLFQFLASSWETQGDFFLLGLGLQTTWDYIIFRRHYRDGFLRGGASLFELAPGPFLETVWEYSEHDKLSRQHIGHKYTGKKRFLTSCTPC